MGWGGQPGRRTATGPNQTVLSTWANRRQRGDRSRAADAQTAPPPVRRTGAPARASRQPAVPSPVAQTPPAPRLSPPPHAPWRARHDAGVTHAANQPFACLHARWEGVAPRGRSRCRTAPVAGARGPPVATSLPTRPLTPFSRPTHTLPCSPGSRTSLPPRAPPKKGFSPPHRRLPRQWPHAASPAARCRTGRPPSLPPFLQLHFFFSLSIPSGLVPAPPSLLAAATAARCSGATVATCGGSVKAAPPVRPPYASRR